MKRRRREARIVRLARDARAHNELIIDVFGQPVYTNVSADTVLWLEGDDLREGDMLRVVTTGEVMAVGKRIGLGAHRVRRGMGACMPQYARAGDDMIVLDGYDEVGAL